VLAIIAGSAAHEVLADLGADPAALAPAETPFGPSSPLGSGALAGEEIVLLARHGASGYAIAAPFVNYRANVWALKERSVTEVISWSGPGAIDDTLRIGQYVVPDDVLDETRGRVGTFFQDTGLGLLRQNPVFCPRLSAALQTAGQAREPEPRIGATYVCTEGPRLETPAEIRKYRALGGHVVGMTLCPEVFLARELELCYAAILYVTNYAEGIKRADVHPERLFGGLASPEEERAQRRAVQGLPGLLEQAAVSRRTMSMGCSCRESMSRHRRSGLVGDDWRRWIKST